MLFAAAFRMRRALSEEEKPDLENAGKRASDWRKGGRGNGFAEKDHDVISLNWGDALIREWKFKRKQMLSASAMMALPKWPFGEPIEHLERGERGAWSSCKRFSQEHYYKAIKRRRFKEASQDIACLAQSKIIRGCGSNCSQSDWCERFYRFSPNNMRLIITSAIDRATNPLYSWHRWFAGNSCLRSPGRARNSARQKARIDLSSSSSVIM